MAFRDTVSGLSRRWTIVAALIAALACFAVQTGAGEIEGRLGGTLLWLALLLAALWIAFTLLAVRAHGRLGLLGLLGAPFVLLLPAVSALFIAGCLITGTPVSGLACFSGL